MRTPFLVLVCVAVLGAGVALQGRQPPGGRFVDAGLVVRDTQTNLVWEKKDSAGGLHDVAKTYTWCQATGNSDGLCAGATSWIGQVNAERLAGFSDWRVPTRDELVGIVDKSVTGCGSGSPCIDPIFGPTKAFRYWASNPAQRTSRGSVDFFAGGPQIDFQLNQFHVRAVRLGP